MTQKIALVTGATRGIGLETVRQLAQKGIHVILAARDRNKGVEAALKLQGEGLSVEAVALDVTDAKSIHAAAQEVEKKHVHLDILVNNAGILADNLKTKPSEQPLDTWHKTFDTNFFGVIAVTQAFLPLLKKSSAGRIVNVSSLLGSLTEHQNPKSPIYESKAPISYNVSKSALNAYTVQLAYEFRDTPLKINTIHPGYVKTDMNPGGAEIEIPEGAKTSVELALIGSDGPNGSFSHLGKPIAW